MQSMGEMLKRQDRESGRSRHWRANLKRLQRELLQLEEDEHVLDSVFPQVSQGGLRWHAEACMRALASGQQMSPQVR